MEEQKNITELMEEARRELGLFEGDEKSWEWFKRSLTFVSMQ